MKNNCFEEIKQLTDLDASVPTDVYSATEKRYVPKTRVTFGRLCCNAFIWLLVIGLIIASFFVNKGSILSINWFQRGLLLAIAFMFSYKGGYIEKLSDIDILFYKEYMVLCRQKKYLYNDNFIKEFKKIYYSNITSLEYDDEENCLIIKGLFERQIISPDNSGVDINNVDFDADRDVLILENKPISDVVDILNRIYGVNNN